ncbi:hypothetical protein EPO05_00055 [Patescibacteria group bacterium]|nr:MAG: hypothetical protein EPO05_00055 [Patescibacteria group bacterium]
MEINRNGLLYKIAYGYFKNPPEQGNLCPFFWRTVFSFFIVWPIWMPIRLTVGNILAFVLFGYWLSPSACHAISWWPEIRGWRFNLGLLLLCSIPVTMIGVVIFWLITDWIPSAFNSTIRFFISDEGRILLSVVATAAAIIFIIVKCSAIRKAEWWLVLKAYLKARKEKFCPLITFVERK